MVKRYRGNSDTTTQPLSMAYLMEGFWCIIQSSCNFLLTLYNQQSFLCCSLKMTLFTVERVDRYGLFFHWKTQKHLSVCVCVCVV